MAQPVWTSKDNPAYTVSGGIVTANQGNWRQGQSDNPLTEPRFIYIWYLDGRHVSGEVPPMSSPPDLHYDGEEQRTLTVPSGVHHVRFDVYAGTHSVYVGAYDVYEWGNGDVVFGYPYSVEFDLTVEAPQVPSVNAPNVQAAQTWLVEALNSLKASYAWTHPTAASYAAAHQAADQIGKAQTFLRGENP